MSEVKPEATKPTPPIQTYQTGVAPYGGFRMHVRSYGVAEWRLVQCPLGGDRKVLFTGYGDLPERFRVEEGLAVEWDEK